MVNRGFQFTRQMKHFAVWTTECNVDCVFSNVGRRLGLSNGECTNEIRQIIVSNGCIGNIEMWNVLREVANTGHYESFRIEPTLEVGAVAAECAFGDGHDEPVALNQHAHYKVRQMPSYCWSYRCEV